MKNEALTCESAREQLSARLDGEGRDEGHNDGSLLAHLARCSACRAHERALAQLGRGFAALRADEAPLADLWPAIESRARRRPAAALVLRAAAALVGFICVGATAFVLEHEPAATTNERHLLERLAPPGGPDALFAVLPEYRVLRAFPNTEEPR
jgi:predicted anti-sigma-YlaC factor YlaD